MLAIESGDDPGEEPRPPDDPLVQERVTPVTVMPRAIEGSRPPCVATADDVGRLGDADLRSLAVPLADELERRRIYD